MNRPCCRRVRMPGGEREFEHARAQGALIAAGTAALNLVVYPSRALQASRYGTVQSDRAGDRSR
jgi:hypothetical protein